MKSPREVKHDIGGFVYKSIVSSIAFAKQKGFWMANLWGHCLTTYNSYQPALLEQVAEVTGGFPHAFRSASLTGLFLSGHNQPCVSKLLLSYTIDLVVKKLWV